MYCVFLSFLLFFSKKYFKLECYVLSFPSFKKKLFRSIETVLKRKCTKRALLFQNLLISYPYFKRFYIGHNEFQVGKSYR